MLGEDDREVIDAICARLDGLPLAIELAADRVRLLPLPALLTRLERRLEVLTEGVRDRPPRQRSLRATLEWSWEVLDEPERRLLCLLTVFEGGVSIDAAVAVCDGDGRVDAVLSSLLDKTSLLRTDAARRSRGSRCSTRCASSLPSGPPTTRSRRRRAPARALLRLLLRASGEGGRARRTAATRSSDWPPSAANLRLAYERLLRAGAAGEALRVAIAFAQALPWDAHTHEVRGWLAGGLAALTEDGPGLHATALYWDGRLAIGQGRFRDAETRIRAALTAAREAGEPALEAAALIALCRWADARGGRRGRRARRRRPCRGARDR